ncbi:uncharacterized protein LOC118668239 isoform X3 [Myotis myotis]|uniref:uncharacterized protein LOC118668239 isoform X3 n=1 Tax=Myotis myotis TaxID=51298 RepID=UPI00174E6A3C|nr:uncharacterized protein LOC118668239 isoform X3 [Myotis myotis]
METSTRFGAEDAKLHFTRSLSTAGLGFETQSRCEGSGHPALPRPTPWLRERRCALPRRQRAHPPRPGAQKPRGASGRHPTERGRDATTPADSINYHCQEIRNRSKRLMYSFRELPQASGRPQGSLARGGTSPLKFQGSYFPSVLGDTSVFSSLLVIRLRHRTCRFVAGGPLVANCE